MAGAEGAVCGLKGKALMSSKSEVLSWCQNTPETTGEAHGDPIARTAHAQCASRRVAGMVCAQGWAGHQPGGLNAFGPVVLPPSRLPPRQDH